jgi:hypothetical protein
VEIKPFPAVTFIPITRNSYHFRTQPYANMISDPQLAQKQAVTGAQKVSPHQEAEVKIHAASFTKCAETLCLIKLQHGVYMCAGGDRAAPE